MKKILTSASIPAHRRVSAAKLTRTALQAVVAGASVENNPLYTPAGESGNNPLHRG